MAQSGNARQGLGRSPGEGNSNLRQYSCLKNPTDRGAWRVTVHGVAESDTSEVTVRTDTLMKHCSVKKHYDNIEATRCLPSRPRLHPNVTGTPHLCFSCVITRSNPEQSIDSFCLLFREPHINYDHILRLPL